MSFTLPVALLLGYLVGLAGAFVLLPREVLAPLSSLATLTAVVVAVAAALALFGRRSAPMSASMSAGMSAGEGSASPVDRHHDGGRTDAAAQEAVVDAEPGIEIAEPALPAASGADGPRLFGPLSPPKAISPVELRRAVAEERVGAVLRPLARPIQPRGTFSEAVARLCAADGQALTPGEYRQVAARLGLLGEVDRVFVRRCVRHLRSTADHGLRLICRIDADSLSAPAFVAELERIVADHPDLAVRLVPAIDRAELSRPARGAMARLRNHGIRFCLARLDVDRLEIATLQQLGVAMVRLEAAPKVERITLVGLDALLDAAGITLLIDRPEIPQLGTTSPTTEAEFMAA